MGWLKIPLEFAGPRIISSENGYLFVDCFLVYLDLMLKENGSDKLR